jgi:ubiquinone/menaquinone biosynthesis C-methylase UbiE
MKIFKDPFEYKSWYDKHIEIYKSERELVKKLELKDCLDIGSGPSIFHDVIKGRIISLDISKEMLKFANKEEDKVVGDAQSLPFRDKSIPCAFVSVTACFVNDVKKMIKEIYRVILKELCICIIPKDSTWGEHYFELGKRGHKYYSRARFLTKIELIKIIKEYFDIINVYSTLTYKPGEEEKFEEPIEGFKGSFVCIKAKPKSLKNTHIQNKQ